MNDFVIHDCTVVDPKNNIQRQTSIAIEGKKIAEVGDEAKGRRFASFPGAVLMPGVIDTHVHCTDWIGGSSGYKMLAREGVTTAVDLAGPASDILDQLAEHGAGINLLVIEAIRPGINLGNSNPTHGEIYDLLDRSTAEGAIGLKLIGGHYPLTEEATRAVFEVAVERRSYIAVHSGSQKNGSNMNGALDSIEFAGGRPFHLAHINAYCRGTVLDDPKEELKIILKELAEHPEIISEFHTAPLNGTSAKCSDGVPESHVTRNCLTMGGYPETEAGLRNAFLEGYAHCMCRNADGLNDYLVGQKALDYWISKKQNVTCSFPVNNREIAFLCATGRKENGEYVIDALSSDGGGIPRNFIIRNGYLLVEWGAWTLNEFVQRTSYVPSKMMGLVNKGHLTPGADADITVFDPATRKVLLTVVGGNVVFAGNTLIGKGGTLFCLKEGGDAAKRRGIPFETLDIENSMLYAGR